MSRSTLSLNRQDKRGRYRCYKCSVYKDATEFYRDASKPEGLSGYCKDCSKSNAKKHQRSLTVDEKRARYAASQKKKKDRERAAKYYQEHKEEHKARVKQWKEDNPERAAKLAKRSSAARSNREEYLKKTGDWDDSITLSELYRRDGMLCAICKRMVPRNEASIDHRHPIKRGGKHTWDNVQLTHLKCNQEKSSHV